MATGQIITAPSCPGTLASVLEGGTYSLTCSQPWESVTGYLIHSNQAAQVDVMLEQSGIDWGAAQVAFGLGLVMFATGSGVGLFINVLRKLKS